jgi:hypothetical protein
MARNPRLLPWLVTTMSLGPAVPTPPDWNALGRRWWSHVETLAADDMEGRDTGSPGYARAADYVIQQFRAAGLQPAGTEGFRQPVDFQVRQLDPAHTSLELLRGAIARPVKLGEEAAHVVSSGTIREADAEATFVGYGLTVPELRYDDLAGIDLRGKFAVLVRGGPSGMPSAVKAHFQSPEERSRALKRAGAVGVVSILNPTIPELPWPRFVSGLLMSRMDLLDPGPEGSRFMPVAIVFNPEFANTLFEGSGHTFDEIRALLGTNEPLPRFPLKARFRSKVAFSESTTRCHNVVGLLPGTDPRLKEEHVVVSAHLDHVGVGTPVNGDPIYHGAIDNASGVASIIEIARAIQGSGLRPRRSLLFLAVTGEEKFLLGSEYFAAHPTVTGPMVANINIDGVWSNFPLRAVEVLGVEESTLGDDIRSLAAEAGIEVHTAYDPDRVLFIRSDQYNFIKLGVPALFPGIGYSKGSPEEKLAHEWTELRYHSPADDAKQPVDVKAAARFNDLLRKLVLRIANAEERPSWKSESFFRRFAR